MINIRQKRIITFLVICGLFMSVTGVRGQMYLFKPGAEKKISSKEMDCYYLTEDVGRYRYNFEFPKLIIMQGSEPLVVFIDEKSSKLIMTEISDKATNIICETPKFGDLDWERWPIIFIKDNKIYLAIYSGYNPPIETVGIKFFIVNKVSKKLDLSDEVSFQSHKRCLLWGIYPYIDKLLITGYCNYICLHELPVIFIGGDPTYYQNASFIVEEGKELTKHPIEERGCHNISKQQYSVSESGKVHALWIKSKRGVGPQYNAIRYSISKDGIVWSDPIELYSLAIKEMSDYKRLQISLASTKNSAYVLWQDGKKGIFLSEISSNNKIVTEKITDMKSLNLDIHEPLPGASTIKVTSDMRNNVYVLWTQYSGKEYKLYFKAKIAGKWSSQAIINQGFGYLKLPDMKVDEKGKVHISYIKSTDPEQPYGEYGCFYMSINPKH